MAKIFSFCNQKGGVGKTTLALALALRHAEEGRTVLLVTSHPLRELAVSVSLAGLKERSPVAAGNLFIIHLDPKEILDSQVKQQIPSHLLAEAVLSSRVYQSLIEVAPGLKELAFLSQLQQLTEEPAAAPGPEAARKFDLLVWDAPATGHFLQTLKVSRNFDLYLSGPFALLGKLCVRLHQRINEIETLSLKNATHRVVRYLLTQLARVKDDSNSFELPMAKQLVAGHLSIQPETFSRIIRRLIDEGIITQEGRQIAILDRQRLEQFE